MEGNLEDGHAIVEVEDAEGRGAEQSPTTDSTVTELGSWLAAGEQLDVADHHHWVGSGSHLSEDTREKHILLCGSGLGE